MKAKVSNQVLTLRRQLYELARAELERRREEEMAEIDPAIVEAARAELLKIYDEMAERLDIP